MSNPFVGEIRLFSFNFAPRNWHLCDGSVLAISQFAALYSLIGAAYGGNGSTSFALPDMRGRTPIHYNTQYPQGLTTGTEAVSLQQGQLPQHNHALQGVSSNGGVPVANAHLYANFANATAYHYGVDTGPLVMLNPTTISLVGGNQPHDNMQPYLTLNYSIAIYGIFPSRN